jgi:hypothetical protein
MSRNWCDQKDIEMGPGNNFRFEEMHFLSSVSQKVIICIFVNPSYSCVFIYATTYPRMICDMICLGM